MAPHLRLMRAMIVLATRGQLQLGLCGKPAFRDKDMVAYFTLQPGQGRLSRGCQPPWLSALLSPAAHLQWHGTDSK
eukprot:gene531-2459_t